ncbi:MAG TPA: type IV secretion system protein [Thermoanaerobaculia bacterium]|nr:type IV secretion system protein [Thermoanaerobaculia bacterium]
MRIRRARRPPTPPAEPPSPREEFFSLWAHQGKQRFQLFLIAVLALSALLVLAVSYVRLAHASRFVPFLYVVDRSGEVLPLGTARPIAADSDAVITSSLATFITSVRAVYHDPYAERASLTKAYVFLPGDSPTATSTGFLEAYLSANDPRLLAERFSRTVEIVSILKVPQKAGPTPASTWRIRWRETVYPVGTALSQSSEWEAFATVRVHAKKTVDAYDPNPFGVFIDHLSWSRLTPEPPQ